MKRIPFNYLYVFLQTYLVNKNQKTGGTQLKKIKVFGLCGRISGKGNSPLDYKDYTSGVYDGNTFMDDIPELRNIADVTFETFLRISSTAIQPKHWLQLRKKIILSLEEENEIGRAHV